MYCMHHMFTQTVQKFCYYVTASALKEPVWGSRHLCESGVGVCLSQSQTHQLEFQKANLEIQRLTRIAAYYVITFINVTYSHQICLIHLSARIFVIWQTSELYIV